VLEFFKNLLSGFNFYFIPAALICIPVHECSHGYAAWRLGDPTARQRGRLTLNPFKHFDPVGVILLIVAGFGWAKPVPVDTRYFKHPRRDMALTSLAGPVSNFILSFLMLVFLNAAIRFFPPTILAEISINLLLYTALLSIGLGVFNLIPIPPLDGSKILFSFLPDRIYYTILRYERYGILILFAIIYLGLITGPLNTMRVWVFEKLLFLADLPFRLILQLL
jgi:Zn-dependent protease